MISSSPYNDNQKRSDLAKRSTMTSCEKRVHDYDTSNIIVTTPAVDSFAGMSCVESPSHEDSSAEKSIPRSSLYNIKVRKDCTKTDEEPSGHSISTESRRILTYSMKCCALLPNSTLPMPSSSYPFR